MAADDAEQRLKRAKQALGHLTPEQLRDAGERAGVPGLSALAGALEAGDDRALIEAMEKLSADALALPARLQAALPALQQFSARLAELEAPAQELAHAQQTLERGLTELRAGVDGAAPDDAELSGLLDRALALARQQAPIDAVRDALSGGAALATQLRAVIESGEAADARKLEASTRSLERALSGAEAAGDALPEAVALLDQAGQLARDRGLGGPRAELSFVAAAVAEAAGDPSAPGRWSQALDDAISTEKLEIAQRAGQRLQLQLAAGAPREAAAVASRVAGLAAKLGQPRAQALARLEEAMHLSAIPEQRPAARALARRAVDLAGASGEPGLIARALLGASQVLERCGDAAEARRGYQRVLKAARLDPEGMRREAGLAALYLARAHAKAGQADEADVLYQLAMEAGAAEGVGPLWAEALMARLGYLAEQPTRRMEVTELLREARALAPRLGGDRSVSALQEVEAELARRLGADVLPSRG